MKSLLFLVCVMFSAISYTQSIDIPDKNFEQALIDKGIDSDKTINGQILRSDVQLVPILDLYNKKIKSLEGIEAFSSLTYLDCRKNHLSSLDVSKNITLNTLYSDVNNLDQTSNEINSFNWFD